MEELIDTQLRPVVRRPDDRIGLLIAGFAAVVCFGFAGTFASPATLNPRTSTPTMTQVALASGGAVVPANRLWNSESTMRQQARPAFGSLPSAQTGHFWILSPADGDSTGPLVHVRLDADRPLGDVHLSVGLGDLVLGWATARIDAPGVVDVPVSVFAPRGDVPLELRVVAAGDPGDGAEMTRRLQVSAEGALDIWSARTVGGSVVLDGFGHATIERISIRLLDRDGGVVAATISSADHEGMRPGSAGGSEIGLASFHAVVDVAAVDAGRATTVVVSWIDPSGRPGSITRDLAEILIDRTPNLNRNPIEWNDSGLRSAIR